MSALPRSDYDLRLPVLDDIDAGSTNSAGAFVIRGMAGVIGLVIVAAFGVSLISVNRSVTGLGRLTAARLWEVNVPHAATYVRVLVQVGDTVTPGQVVAQLEMPERLDELRLIESRVALLRVEAERLRVELAFRSRQHVILLQQAQDRLAAARATFLGRLVDLGIKTSPEEVMDTHKPGSSILLDQAVSAYRDAWAQKDLESSRPAQFSADSLALRRVELELSQATTDMAAARQRVDSLTVRAPAFGTVTADSTLPAGNVVRARGELLFRVAEPSWMALVSIREGDVRKVRVGQDARLELTALDESVIGVVERIGTSALHASVPQAESYYPVWIAVRDAPSGTLRSGYSIDARILLGKEPALRSLLRTFVE